MADPYLGEIRVFAGNYAPVGWALCDGSLLEIQSNQPLFSILGTIYGGDGQSTFALPNLINRVPVSVDQGPNLSNYTLGQVVGQTQVLVTSANIPVHNHGYLALTTPATSQAPAGNMHAAMPGKAVAYYTPPPAYSTPTVTMATQTLQTSGTANPHENRMPFLGVSYIISLSGMFPTSTKVKSTGE